MHDLYNESMMYAGATPWHKLGVAIPSNATWQDCKGIVGFYEALERPLYVPGLTDPLANYKAIVASNDGRPLSVVGADYGVVQFDDLAEQVMTACQGEAVFHTAGLLGDDGARGWLLGELTSKPMTVPGDSSTFRPFFLATTSHDGAHAALLKNVTERVVCRNTLGTALGESGGQWSIRHTSNAAARVKAAGTAFARLRKGFETFGELASLMARATFRDADVVKVLDKVLPIPEAQMENGKVSNERAIDNAQDKRRHLAQLAAGRMLGATGITGTAWGAFQAFTEYTDHHGFQRGRLASDLGARLNSLTFGTGALFKERSLASILSVAGIQAPRVAVPA